MRISYTMNGDPFDFDAQEEEDLRTLAEEITEHLQAQHVELKTSADLPILVTNGMLNNLADDAEEVALGELVRKA